MQYDWDPGKASENLRKHGGEFADAVIAPEDKNALTIEDKDQDERRFKTPGMGPYASVLFVVHGDCIRIISARKANRKEVRQYCQGLE